MVLPRAALALFLFPGSVVATGPAPLDRLAIILPGIWQTEGQTFDTDVTKAGSQRYTTTHDCWHDTDAYKCVYVVNGTLQLYDIYSWDAQDNVYLMTRITAQGKQPEFHVSVSGNVWTWGQDIVTPQGKVVHYRIVRTYASAEALQYTYAISDDGKQWTEIAKGMETRVDAQK